MDQQAMDAKTVEQIAAVLQDYGYFSFAAAALVALGVFRKDPMLRWVFAGVFVAAAITSAVVYIFIREPQRIAYGSFDAFNKEAEPSVTSTDANFYVAHRFDSDNVQVDWLYLVPAAAPIVRDIRFSFHVKKRKIVLATEPVAKKVEEIALIGGIFDLPSATFTSEKHKPLPYFAWKKKLVEDEGGTKICFAGAKLPDKFCSRPIDADMSSASLPETRHGSLLQRLLGGLLASAFAQPNVVALTGKALEDALTSTDTRRWAEATREIEKAPEAQAALINAALERPVQANTYTSRLAVVTAMRSYYVGKGLIYPDATTLAWLSDTSWRRIVLDSFDRSDALGDASRRVLRIAKSPQAKTVLDSTTAQVRTVGDAAFATCLDLLIQDIYGNWALLSLENMKNANSLSAARVKSLAGLLEPIAMAEGAALAEAYRLRANYLHGVLLLEASDSLGQAERQPIADAGIAELRKVKAVIDRLGLAALRPVYPVDPGELDKTNAFFSRMAETGTLSLEPLRSSSSPDQRPYPSCKL
jgi:hypothetical protein